MGSVRPCLPDFQEKLEMWNFKMILIFKILQLIFFKKSTYLSMFSIQWKHVFQSFDKYFHMCKHHHSQYIEHFTPWRHSSLTLAPGSH